jgi:hypothetical protein
MHFQTRFHYCPVKVQSNGTAMEPEKMSLSGSGGESIYDRILLYRFASPQSFTQKKKVSAIIDRSIDRQFASWKSSAKPFRRSSKSVAKNFQFL